MIFWRMDKRIERIASVRIMGVGWCCLFDLFGRSGLMQAELAETWERGIMRPKEVLAEGSLNAHFEL